METRHRRNADGPDFLNALASICRIAGSIAVVLITWFRNCG
jgi:hypothetical protein